MESKEKRQEIKQEVKDIKFNIKEENKNIKTKEEKRKFKKVIHKKFDKIYRDYGQKAYKKYVPKNYQNANIKSLLKEQRFLEIYNKHGEKAFENYIAEIQKMDTEYETGSKIKSQFNKIKYNIMHEFFPGALTVALALPAITSMSSECNQYKERLKYSEEIKEYIDDVKEYGESVKKYNLSDIQNIMKVMDDMWENIDGYGIPKVDISACLGLDMSKENREGVCRNMADDVSRKLNVINPEYNARCIAVYMEDGQYTPANIKSKYAEDYKKEQQEESNKIDATKVFGNHAVVLIDLPDESIELVVDPTNSGIGVLQNGKITLFNSEKENGVTDKVMPAGSTIYGVKSTLEVTSNYINSIGFSDLEKLEEKFGIDAQNKALEEVRALDINNFSKNLKYNIKSNTAIIPQKPEDLNPKTENKKIIQEEPKER